MNRFRKALIGGIAIIGYILLSIVGFIILVGLYLVPYLER